MEGMCGSTAVPTDAFNTPYNAAQAIFQVLEIGDPVIVYYSTDQPVGPSPTQELEMG